MWTEIFKNVRKEKQKLYKVDKMLLMAYSCEISSAEYHTSIVICIESNDNQNCRHMLSLASSPHCPQKHMWQASLSVNIYIKVEIFLVTKGDKKAWEMPFR